VITHQEAACSIERWECLIRFLRSLRNPANDLTQLGSGYGTYFSRVDFVSGTRSKTYLPTPGRSIQGRLGSSPESNEWVMTEDFV
jgi:hypothetical protein